MPRSMTLIIWWRMSKRIIYVSRLKMLEKGYIEHTVFPTEFSPTTKIGTTH